MFFWFLLAVTVKFLLTEINWHIFQLIGILFISFNSFLLVNVENHKKQVLLEFNLNWTYGWDTSLRSMYVPDTLGTSEIAEKLRSQWGQENHILLDFKKKGMCFITWQLTSEPFWNNILG